MKKLYLTISEEQLVALLYQRDGKAFSILYERYSSVLFGIILKIVHSQELAEDVLQEAFINIWQHSQTYNPSKGRVFTWVLNIARNLAIDKTRSLYYKRSVNEYSLENYSIIADRQRYTEIHADDVGLKKVISSLPPEQKMLLDLIYFQGFTHLQVAGLLHQPLGTIKTKIRKTLLQLREQLKLREQLTEYS